MFIYEMSQFNTNNRHIKPSPKIWFETEHFENLGFFRALGLGFRPSPLEHEMDLDKNYHVFWKDLNYN